MYAHNLAGFDGNFVVKAYEKYRSTGISFPQERLDLEGENRHKYETFTVKLGNVIFWKIKSLFAFSKYFILRCYPVEF